MEAVLELSTWISLLTLVLLEVVLGIDNLVFIAILANKLPENQRDKARMIGLSLALVMRLFLLTIMTWLMRLNTPFIEFYNLAFSVRDLILIGGGIFLLQKSVAELHERLEGEDLHGNNAEKVSFWVVIVQIIVLDAVFSLDAIITATHMAEHLWVMMLAVIISIGVMIFAAKPLTAFLARHPTVVVLCLSFLLMIGISLVAEGFGFHVPKGYLYAAIGFSIFIEFFNQFANFKSYQRQFYKNRRERISNTVLNLLTARGEIVEADHSSEGSEGFGKEERDMVSGVLTLHERSIRSIMTPRNEIEWIDLHDKSSEILDYIMQVPHNHFLLCDSNLDGVVGVARAKDLIRDLTIHGVIDRENTIRPPIFAHKSTNILNLMETLRGVRGQMVIITDEFGSVQGIVTLIDVFEAIAGEFPDEDEQPSIQPLPEGGWLIEGSCDLHLVELALGIENLIDNEEDFSSLAGFIIHHYGSLPEVGEVLNYGGFTFKVLEADARRIMKVEVQLKNMHQMSEITPTQDIDR